MDRHEVQALLRDVAAGSVSADAALEQLAAGPTVGVADLGFARVDTHRGLRTGDPEVVYAAGKTPEQTVAILRQLAGQPGERPAIATRVGGETLDAVRAAFPDALVDEVAGTVAVGALPPPKGLVAVVAAGTSDAPVAAEAAFVARAFGAGVERIDDVGVAGIHRLLAVRDRLDAADCLVVCAGMEGALPSVVGGLTGVPMVAVPTSVGYGASFGGLAALLAMLNSCAPGVAVCNIDNGFGAGVFAARVARRVARRAHAVTDPSEESA
jgi:NCAIR mutase (PurE)-related protein